MNDLISYLFETNAMRICPENKPFWYTSGKIGPYYINTQFLYGSEEIANELLEFIDIEKQNPNTLPKKIHDKVLNNYLENSIYKTIIDKLINYISKNIDLSKIEYISGGERRDWFFSFIVADLLKKPHITLYKDLNAVITNSSCSESLHITDLKGANVLHVADLITEASSYFRNWLPAIDNLNGNIQWSFVIVNRKQGGDEKLEAVGIKSFSMINVDASLFEEALNKNIINTLQYDMLNDFYKSPDTTMKTFIKQHPEFLKNALISDEKTKKRAILCIKNEFYT